MNSVVEHPWAQSSVLGSEEGESTMQTYLVWVLGLYKHFFFGEIEIRTFNTNPENFPIKLRIVSLETILKIFPDNIDAA